MENDKNDLMSYIFPPAPTPPIPPLKDPLLPANVMDENQARMVSEENFKTRVNTYIALNKPKLYILTPCYGSVVYTSYMTCLINTIALFQLYGFKLKYEICNNDSLVPRARNNLIARAMNDPEMTHMLFIDADISWEPLDVLRLVLDNKPIVGGIYPLKHYYFEKLQAHEANPVNIVGDWVNKKRNSALLSGIGWTDTDFVVSNLLNYNVNYISNNIQIDKSLIKIRHLATGFMMIKRGAIENMAKAFPSTKYVDDVSFLHGTENDFAYALFDCGVENGHYFSEDWLFCHRWTQMGGDVYCNISINLVHIGIEHYKGSLACSLLS